MGRGHEGVPAAPGGRGLPGGARRGGGFGARVRLALALALGSPRADALEPSPLSTISIHTHNTQPYTLGVSS